MTDHAQHQPPTLQQAIESAGSPIALLWDDKAPSWVPPGIQDEFTDWREEITAGYETASLCDLSQHMPELVFSGPGALPFLQKFLVNDLEHFAVNQAKQVVAVEDRGYLIGDGILTRDADESFTLTGVPYIQTWLRYQAGQGDYDMSVSFNPDASLRAEGENPKLFRYQLMGPKALEIVENMFGGPLPKTKFFHLTEVELEGRKFRALRHGMLGQAGYEFIGSWDDQPFVLETILRHGEPLGLRRVGALAYALTGVESGWLPIPIAGIFDSEELKAYRESISLYSFEGMYHIGGSFHSDDIRDYYVTPFELGYGKVIDFDRDFYGKSGVEQLRDRPGRQKVTLVFDAEQSAAVWGDGAKMPYVQSYGHYRVEADGKLVGIASYTGSIPHAGTVLALALVDEAYAAEGCRVVVVWGEGDESTQTFARIDAVVQPSPYDAYARSSYRRDE